LASNITHQVKQDSLRATGFSTKIQALQRVMLHQNVVTGQKNVLLPLPWTWTTWRDFTPGKKIHFVAKMYGL
jgi:hypothetical protein